MNGFASGPCAVVSTVVRRRRTRVFVRSDRAPVGGVTVMDSMTAVGGVTTLPGNRRGVMPMSARRAAASGAMVVAVMR